ncbi:hypothetical protein K1719_038826 [Acacia pycnantha]|nr:hypothetical protein K1719_038826 [Acacia pycnantha]
MMLSSWRRSLVKIIPWVWRTDPNLKHTLRNLEGKELGRYVGSTKGKPKIESYDKDRKKGAGGLITPAKTYNPTSDSTLG